MKKLILLLALLLLQNLSYAQNYAVIGATDVKMRTIANTNSEIVTMLQLGDVAEILDESHDYVRVSGVDKPYKWFKLKVNNKIGWVFGAFVFSKINKFERISSGNSEGFLVGSFANQTNDCAPFECAENFMAFIPGNFETTKKARIVNFKGKSAYRGMYSFGHLSLVQSGFVKLNGDVVLVIDLFYGYQILELKWNGTAYDAVEICKISE
jgi:hypothetical protein